MQVIVKNTDTYSTVKVSDNTHYAVVDNLDAGNYAVVDDNNRKESKIQHLLNTTQKIQEQYSSPVLNIWSDR